MYPPRAEPLEPPVPLPLLDGPTYPSSYNYSAAAPRSVMLCSDAPSQIPLPYSLPFPRSLTHTRLPTAQQLYIGCKRSSRMRNPVPIPPRSSSRSAAPSAECPTPPFIWCLAPSESFGDTERTLPSPTGSHWFQERPSVYYAYTGVRCCHLKDVPISHMDSLGCEELHGSHTHKSNIII